MNVSKNIESSSPTPANDGAPSAEDSAFRELALSCHREPQQMDFEAPKHTDQAKGSAEKLFLGRMSETLLRTSIAKNY